MLGVAVTAKCPNKCEICGIKYRKDNLNPGTLRSCIDEVCGMGFRSFGVSGGEPVENKNTLRMIEYASSSGLSCHLTDVDKHAVLQGLGPGVGGNDLAEERMLGGRGESIGHGGSPWV